MPRPPTEPELQAIDELKGIEDTVRGTANRINRTDIVWNATPLDARLETQRAMSKLREAAEHLKNARHFTLDAGKDQA